MEELKDRRIACHIQIYVHGLHGEIATVVSRKSAHMSTGQSLRAGAFRTIEKVYSSTTETLGSNASISVEQMLFFDYVRESCSA